MESLLIAGFVLAVLALMAWLFTVIGVAYAIYRFVWQPWRVMRTDINALNEAVKALAAQVQRAQVLAHSDEETARIEARMNARQRARSTQEGFR